METTAVRPKPAWNRPPLVLLLVLILLPAAACGPVAAAQGGPVVLELFTSQGCSSCPPADRLLRRLAEDPEFGGRVIPLAFHVDYWNYIGWRDPFSSPRWSQRQQAYAGALEGARVYTPQLVVGGRSDCVGSREPEVRREIRHALERPPAGRVEVETGAPTGGVLEVRVAVELAEAAGEGGELELWVALYESGLVTPVGRGENSGRTLHNDFVVRRFQKALTLPAVAGSRAAGEVSLALDEGWVVANLGVAAFLQHPGSLAIHGAAVQPVPVDSVVGAGSR